MCDVIALFDETVEKEIYAVWNELCRNGISYYSKGVLIEGRISQLRAIKILNKNLS